MSELPQELIAPSTTITYAPGLPFSLKSQIEMALQEIGLLHRVPKRVHAHVAQNAKRNEQGSYDPKTTRIEISRHATDPLGTFVHEYGHLVDDLALHPLRNEYGSRYDLDYTPLLTACFDSRPVREMVQIAKSMKGRLLRADTFYLKVVCRPQEVFARAYAQWICSRSFNLLLQLSLQRRITARVQIAGRFLRLQWEPDEFADIMAEMERLFHIKGLR